MTSAPAIKHAGIWKQGKCRPGGSAFRPKGRVLDEQALQEIRALLTGKERRADLLIEYLHLIQDKYGHLSAAHLHALAEEMNLSQAHVFEVATFYAHFDVVKEGETPPPALTIRVCDSLSCELAGAQDLLTALQNGELGEVGKDVRFLRAPCMGRCHTAPTVALGHHHIDHATLDAIRKAIAAGDTSCRIPDYQDYLAYCANGGYEALRACRLEKRSRAGVTAAIDASGLRGLGGAGFPAARKWKVVGAEPAPRFLVVNGDEGEPGTFKDRHYLEREPHVFLEGMLIAAWAIKAQKTYIYMRDEYPAVIKILRREIAALEHAGLIEAGSVELRRGAGAYICGEESAMIESIEGKRGLPRHRPPYVASVGLFGRPTLVHNVETLYWIARVTREGPEILNSVEKNGRRGLRSYSVSGRVKAPGVKLLPAGSTIRDIIEASGGMCDGHEFKAWQPGGPSSGLLPASLDNIPLDFDSLQLYGSFIGCAAVVILSDKDSARAATLNMLRFFEDESCGQCTPCRLGCEKAVKLMQAGRWDQALLEDLCQTMEDASICGLGQAAPNAIRLTMKHFPDEV